MAARSISIRFFKSFDNSGPQGAEANVASPLRKIELSLEKNRFAALLKKTAASAVTVAESPGTAAHQPAHDGSHGNVAGRILRVSVFESEGSPLSELEVKLYNAVTRGYACVSMLDLLHCPASRGITVRTLRISCSRSQAGIPDWFSRGWPAGIRPTGNSSKSRGR